MKKILAINGSHRGPKGHTAFLLEKLSRGAVSAGAEFEIVHLAGMKIHPCLSCGTCNRTDHYLKCVYDEKDDVRAIFDKMAATEIVVYATPIYVFTMSSLMKAFLERMYAVSDVFDLTVTRNGLVFHHVNREICSKPFVALVCCDNIEKETPKNVISYFKNFARFNEAAQVGLLVRNAGRFAGHGQKPELVQGNPKLARVYDAFECAGRELTAMGRISRSNEKAAAADIIPMPAVFHVLRHFRFFKEKMVQKAKESMSYEKGAV